VTALLLACTGVYSASAAQIKIEPIFELKADTSDPSLSPDGKMLAFDWCKPDYSCALYLRPLSGGPVRLLTGTNGQDFYETAPRWSPGGTAIAFVRWYSHYNGHLCVRDLSNRKERDLGPIAGDGFSWGPNGRFLAASEYVSATNVPGNTKVVLISADGRTARRQLAESGDMPAFSPSGDALAYGDGNVLKLLSLDSNYTSKSPARVIATEPRDIVNVCWAADGKRLLYRVWGDSPYLESIGIGENEHPGVLPETTSSLEISQLLADGSGLATESIAKTAVWRVNLTLLAPTPELVSQPSPADYPGISPDGRRGVTIGQEKGVSQIWLENVNGTNKRVLVKSVPPFTDPDDFGVPTSLEWSPDSKWIMFTAGPFHGNADLRSWLYIVPASGGPLRRLAAKENSIVRPCWAPDSKSIFASTGSFDLVRIDLAKGTLTAIPGGQGILPHVSPDGRFLYYFTLRRHELRRLPVAGGREEKLLGGDYEWGAADKNDGAIYLFQMLHNDPNPFRCNLIRFDPAKHEERTITSISFRPESAFIAGGFLYLYEEDDPYQRIVRVQGLGIRN
jgi:Tol biopolymer transport system component